MDDPDLFAYQTLTEKYLRNFNSFLENYSEKMVQIIGDDGSANKSLSNIDALLLPPSTQIGAVVPTFAENSAYPIELVWEPLGELLSFEELVMMAVHNNNQHYSGGSNGIMENGSYTSDVQKVMLVLVSLTNQLKQHYKYGWNEFVYQFVLYGDLFESTGKRGSQNSTDNSSSSTTTEEEGNGHVTFSKFIPTLYNLAQFTQQAQQLLSHCIHQLSSLFKDSRPHVVTITGFHCSTMFQEIGSLLSLFVMLDEIIFHQPILKQHWLKYKRMIKSVRADTNTFGIDSEKLVELEKNLAKLDKSVMSAHLFLNTIEKIQSDWKERSSGGGSRAKNNVMLIEQFTYELTRMSLTLDKEFHEGIEPFKPISFTTIYLLASTLFTPTFDSKKIFTRIIWENLKRIPAVPIAGTYLWIPDEFLSSFQKQQQLHHHQRSSSNISQLITPKLSRAQLTAREAYLEQKMLNLQKDIQLIQYQVAHWTLQLQQIFCCNKQLTQLNLEDLIARCNLLIHGLKLAQLLNLSFRLLINLHVLLGKSITKQMVAYLCQYMEALKTIQSTFQRYNKQICYTMLFIIQTVLHIALTNIHHVGDALANTNGMNAGGGGSSNSLSNGVSGSNVSTERDELRRDGLIVVKMLEYILKGSPSQERLLIAKIAFEWSVASSRYWKDSEQKLTVEAALERIITISEIQDRITALCNCCDIYWHRILFNSYFSFLYKNESEVSKLPLIFLILQDSISMLNEKSANHQRDEILQNFVREIEEYSQENIIDKLCQDIETDLRLQSHSHLQQSQHTLLKVDESSPFRSGLKDFSAFLNIPSFVLSDKKFSLKYLVEQYLSKNFYNLASVALHDWQSYATMRVLAMEKYQLNVIQDNLPGHSLEQGLDILAIVRNINKFVTEFSYNLNNQVFIQMHSPNKHLDTVNIRHLANSIRTHGPGMANTTVNFTYQFLRKKIHIFSQFLYDEQIKSRLSRDIRYFKQGRQNSDTSSSTFSFPYDRAIKFQRGIRKLGLTQDGLSPLDQFRILITHIGNALGFVRLVRSGCFHFLAAGSRFVTDLDDAQFNELELLPANLKDSFNSNWRDELKSSIECLSNSLGTFVSKGSSIDYFSLLAKAFAGPCRSESNVHMRNFYVIIPALTLSYVDHMRVCKEKLSKKTKGTTIFTDDGFPMGVAYLLKVLGQDTEFDSLQWFAGVSKKLLEERKIALQTISESKNDEKLQQASTLTAKRLHDILQEFHLLRYNLSSARIFFQKNEPVLLVATGSSEPVGLVPSSALPT